MNRLIDGWLSKAESGKKAVQLTDVHQQHRVGRDTFRYTKHQLSPKYYYTAESDLYTPLTFLW
jgi:hypothetical protein